MRRDPRLLAGGSGLADPVGVVEPSEAYQRYRRTLLPGDSEVLKVHSQIIAVLALPAPCVSLFLGVASLGRFARLQEIGTPIRAVLARASGSP